MLKRIMMLICIAVALTFSTIGFASVNDDQVTSQKIREADGTSGQNTNAGSGVKTGHIQDNAVTTNKIADGAVTDAKITGSISTTKLSVGTAAGTVAAGEHTHDTAYQKKYANVVVVARSGGNFTDPIAALSSITDASATNTYLVKIMPGTYELPRNTTLNAKSHVDIEGSGAGITKIRHINDNGGQLLYVYYVTNSEVRNITLEAETTTTTGAAFGAISINYSELRVKDVGLNVIGGGNGTGIILWEAKAGIKNVGITYSNTPATATGTGVFVNLGSSVQMDDVTIEAKTAMNYLVGVHFAGTEATVKHLKLIGFDFTNSQYIGAYVVSPASIKFYDSMLVRVGAMTGGQIIAVNSMVDELMLYTPDGLRPLGGKFKGVNCFNSSYDPVNLNN